MHKYIELGRRFLPLTRDELADTDALVIRLEFNSGALGWAELLNERRVILLAEAGSGKTREMQEQAARMFNAGNAAFFIAIEALQGNAIADQLTRGENVSLDQWKRDDSATAWFFLDAVDELKLTEGKLDQALRRFAKELDGHLDRARVVISCRPNDWLADFDTATVERHLPAPGLMEARSAMSTDEAFASLVSRSELEKEDQKPLEPEQIVTVVMAPMSDLQIRTLAEELGVTDASSFLLELERQNAWTFARRPFDLIELVSKWRRDGRLGTRADQHETNISSKLRESPDRPDEDVLTTEKSGVGAERLALSLALTKTRTLKSPDQSLDPSRAVGILDPSEALSDWTTKEQRSLLRRGLFDPATYGRVKFHHRSVQEFLAARRLRYLRSRGMSKRALFRMLFATKYGYEVVIPSMRAIAAWLSLWDPEVLPEVMNREPEILLTLGDPESLSISSRAELLRQFAELYGMGGNRGLEVPLDEVRRLAHPELSPVVRDLWSGNPENPDVRVLLLELILKGPLDRCSDIAEAAAAQGHTNSYERIVAVRAVLACDQPGAARRLAAGMLSDRERWPDRVVHGVAVEMFPEVITPSELTRLIRRTREPKRTIGGFNWALRRRATELDVLAPNVQSLRDKLARLVLFGRRKLKQEFWRLQSKYSHVCDALAVLCQRELDARCERPESLIASCVVATVFHGKDGSSDSIDGLRQYFADDLEAREKAFWIHLAVVDKLFDRADDWDRLYYATHHSLLKNIAEVDRPWLEAAAAVGVAKRRGVAITALIQLWNWRGSKVDERTQLLSLVADDSALAAEVAAKTASQDPTWRTRKYERDARRRECIRRRREERRLQSWKVWRAKQLENPGNAFSGAELKNTLANIYKLLGMSKGSHANNLWDRQVVAESFGEMFASQTEAAFVAYWRCVNPKLWSERKKEERNTTYWSWIHGLCGVAAESAAEGWADRLSVQEARLATKFATVELNGFADFIGDLVRSHPLEVEAVLGDELDKQLRLGSSLSHVPLLQNIAHASVEVKHLMRARLLRALTRVPKAVRGKGQANWAVHVSQIFRGIGPLVKPDERSSVTQECLTRLTNALGSDLRMSWLQGLFAIDPVMGANWMCDSLGSDAPRQHRAQGVFALAALFGHHGGALPVIDDLPTRVKVLAQLVRMAYRVVRPADDVTHEGVFSPSTRDEAEQARNVLLSALLSTPGPQAQEEIVRMAGEEEFAHFPDRLRLLARRRAAEDSEFSPLSPSAIRDMEVRLELPSNDRDSLFQVMLDRLDDLNEFYQHADFSDRKTVRKSTDEVEMQRAIASRLSAMANGAYLITREEEVADLKKTDIRFLAPHGGQKAVAEIKVADGRYSISDYARALRNQLVGQYLRHNDCRAGCLLLTYDGKKRYWIHPKSKQRMSFADLVSDLQEEAASIEREMGGVIRLTAVGIDLTDPVLAPAHRSQITGADSGTVMPGKGSAKRGANRSITSKATANKATAKKAVVEKAIERKATAKKATAKNATAKKATAKKATAKKATAKKVAAKKATAEKATAKKVAAKKATAKKGAASRRGARA